MNLLELLFGNQSGNADAAQYYNNFVGRYGETRTAVGLDMIIDGNYRILKNLYIPHNGKTSEIDILLLHEKGIFVFESKNYSGWIFGSQDQFYWTQSLKNGQKHQFYNPIKQNEVHIKALSKLLSLPISSFYSYIAFSNRCELKKVPPSTEETVIGHRMMVLIKLKSKLESLPVVYSLPVIDYFFSVLEEFSAPSKEEKQRHIELAKETVNSDICPVCHSKLVERTGRYGPFLGCSSYPKCTYTRTQKNKNGI